MNPTHKLIFTFFVSEPHIKELLNIYHPIEQKGFFYYSEKFRMPISTLT